MRRSNIASGMAHARSPRRDQRPQFLTIFERFQMVDCLVSPPYLRGLSGAQSEPNADEVPCACDANRARGRDRAPSTDGTRGHGQARPRAAAPRRFARYIPATTGADGTTELPGCAFAAGSKSSISSECAHIALASAAFTIVVG